MNLLFCWWQFKLGQIRRKAVRHDQEPEKCPLTLQSHFWESILKSNPKQGESYSYETAEVAYMSNNRVMVNYILFTW